MARLAQAPTLSFSYASGPLLAFHTLRLSAGIARLLRSGRVNVFHLNPLYGFSRVTARIGLVYLAVMGLNLVSELVLEIGSGGSELWIGVFLTSAAAVASFVLPLLGTHARIVEAEDEALAVNSEHVEQVRSRMYAELEDGNTDAFKGLDDALGGLLRMGETLRAIPSWPWSAGTFRAFFTAIGVPILVFVIQRILDSVL